SESLPVLMLAAAFGPAEAGFYSLARLVIHLPLNIIGKSVADVYFPRFNSHALAGQALLPFFLKSVTGLAIIGLPISLLMYCLSPLIFPVVFGIDWALAGLFASLLCPMLFIQFANRPCVGAVPVLGLQRAQLINTTAFTIVKFGFLLIGA